MPAEHVHLVAAAQRKSENAVARARSALRLMHDSGADISFAAVAHHAAVSRQWLYKNEDLRAEIEKLRGRQTGARRVPASQRASDASLRQRSALLGEENKRLRREVRTSSMSSPNCTASDEPARSVNIELRNRGNSGRSVVSGSTDAGLHLSRLMPAEIDLRAALNAVSDVIQNPPRPPTSFASAVQWSSAMMAAGSGRLSQARLQRSSSERVPLLAAPSYYLSSRDSRRSFRTFPPVCSAGQ